MEPVERIQYALEQTQVLRFPRQVLATFGVTRIRYYLLTRPVYVEFTGNKAETVIREGHVVAEKPRVVTPFYMRNLFEGFEHGREYLEYILRRYGPSEPGLLYQYRNTPEGLSIVSEPVETTAHRLKEEVERREDPMVAVIQGVDEMWDVSLMKFIFEWTRDSLRHNILDLERSGLLEVDSRGIPREAQQHIEELFHQVRRGRLPPQELKAELDRWGVFPEYEDRFLDLFRR